jgi:hypothetical protein
MKYLTLSALSLASALLLLPSCDSKEEERREKALERKADTLEDAAKTARERGEKTADNIENSDPGLNSNSTERAAAEARKEAERKADQLEDAADSTREKK